MTDSGEGRGVARSDAAATFIGPAGNHAHHADRAGHAADAPSDALHAEAEQLGDAALEHRLDRLEAEVVSLRAAGGRTPWYRQVGTLIGVVALFFSFGTTFVSYDRIARQDAHDRRVELLGLIGRITAIQREAAAAAATYRNDPGTLTGISSYLNQEQLLDAKQAARVMETIPDQVVAAEYALVGTVLLGNSIDDEGLALLDRAIATARDANDLVAALRVSAGRNFELRRLDEGRKRYADALKVFDLGRFPSLDRGYIDSTNFDTHMNWAYNELRLGTCDAANEHIALARGLASGFSPTDPRQGQLASLEPQVATCKPPGASPNPLPAATPAGASSVP